MVVSIPNPIQRLKSMIRRIIIGVDWTLPTCSSGGNVILTLVSFTLFDLKRLHFYIIAKKFNEETIKTNKYPFGQMVREVLNDSPGSAVLD